MTFFTDFITIPAIAAIVYTIIDVVKTALGNNENFNRFIPLLSLALGSACGIIAFFLVPGVLETSNIIIAIVVGGASGLSATGTNQAVKQLTSHKTTKD